MIRGELPGAVMARRGRCEMWGKRLPNYAQAANRLMLFLLQRFPEADKIGHTQSTVI